MLEYLRLKCTLCITIGRYDDATAVCEKVLSMREIPWANMELGKIYFLTGDYLKAKEKFQSVIFENKTYMEAYDWLAKTLEELGSMEEAQQALLTATEISPKAILRHQAIGDISFKIKDYDAAEEAFRKALALEPDLYKTHFALTYLRRQTNKDNHLTPHVILDLTPTLT